jgi:hypothetical protein
MGFLGSVEPGLAAGFTVGVLGPPGSCRAGATVVLVGRGLLRGVAAGLAGALVLATGVGTGRGLATGTGLGTGLGAGLGVGWLTGLGCGAGAGSGTGAGAGTGRSAAVTVGGGSGLGSYSTSTPARPCSAPSSTFGRSQAKVPLPASPSLRLQQRGCPSAAGACHLKLQPPQAPLLQHLRQVACGGVVSGAKCMWSEQFRPQGECCAVSNPHYHGGGCVGGIAYGRQSVLLQLESVSRGYCVWAPWPSRNMCQGGCVWCAGAGRSWRASSINCHTSVLPEGVAASMMCVGCADCTWSAPSERVV